MKSEFVMAFVLKSDGMCSNGCNTLTRKQLWAKNSAWRKTKKNAGCWQIDWPLITQCTGNLCSKIICMFRRAFGYSVCLVSCCFGTTILQIIVWERSVWRFLFGSVFKNRCCWSLVGYFHLRNFVLRICFEPQHSLVRELTFFWNSNVYTSWLKCGRQSIRF